MDLRLLIIQIKFEPHIPVDNKIKYILKTFCKKYYLQQDLEFYLFSSFHEVTLSPFWLLTLVLKNIKQKKS